MRGWIVYNGSLKFKKIEALVTELYQKSLLLGMNLTLVKNNEIISLYNEVGTLILSHVRGIPLPDYVIFWDKDVLLAKNFEFLGIRVFNSSDAIENCDSKALTIRNLQDGFIPIPKTILSPFVFHELNPDKDYIKELIRIIGFPMIVKEHRGSFGMQVYMANNEQELSDLIPSLQNKPFLIQECIQESIGKDIRVVIVGNEIVGAMLRYNHMDFRANITLGASAEQITLSKEQEELALKVHRRMELDFSGVDILLGKDGPVFCEINSNVNFLSYEKLSGISVSERILTYINKEMQKI